jgi:glycerophosphoryl diester phosphodiesterase
MVDHARVPRVIAHRGASAYAPENTRAAFDLALELGAPEIETDVRSTRDGRLVLLHDERVDRTTSGKGRLADLELAEVGLLDAGSWFAARFAGQRIPTLADFLEEYARRVPICLEIKAPSIESALLAEVEALGPSAGITYTSFSIEAVARIRQLSPTARTGYLATDFSPASVDLAVRAGASQICPPAWALDSEAIEGARRLGLEVRAWGVSSEELEDRAISLKVDGLTTNWPDRALALLALALQRGRFAVDQD